MSKIKRPARPLQPPGKKSRKSTILRASKTKSRKPAARAETRAIKAIREALTLGHLLAEKCELRRAEESFAQALKLAKQAHDLRATMEALSGLMRLASVKPWMPARSPGAPKS